MKNPTKTKMANNNEIDANQISSDLQYNITEVRVLWDKIDEDFPKCTGNAAARRRIRVKSILVEKILKKIRSLTRVIKSSRKRSK
jgi:hypothetical protein